MNASSQNTTDVAALLTNLEQRVAQLEIDLTRALQHSSSNNPNVITAPFYVLDKGGQKIFEVDTLMSENPSGNVTCPFIRLYNHDGTSPIGMYVLPKGASVTLSNDSGNEVLSLVADVQGGKVSIFDGEGLIVNRTTNQNEYREVLNLGAGKQHAYIRMFNDENLPCIALEGNATGGAVGIYSNENEAVASLAASVSGGNLIITSNNGQMAAWLFADANGGNFELFDGESDQPLDSGTSI